MSKYMGLTRFIFMIWLTSVSQIALCFTAQAQSFLSNDEAFQVHASMVNTDQVQVSVNIADGYYLYRERLSFASEKAQLGTPLYPQGEVKYDPNFEKDVEIYSGQIQIVLPMTATGPFDLAIHSQGCSEQGICYPPKTTTVILTPDTTVQPAVHQGYFKKSLDNTAQTLHSGSLWLLIGVFFVLGVGLSLTPCVLPMVPILSTIIVGDTHSKNRSFTLSLCYVLGMAVVYTVMGVIAGLVGEGLAIWLQQPAVLIIFALIMLLLALSLFDVYQLQMPQRIQNYLTNKSNTVKSGKHVSTIIMGALSALIIGPCVAAPLAGVLLYIGQTHHAVQGGIALFSLAIGMGVPLLCIGLFSKAVLPRLGAWMTHTKYMFGVGLIATAIWIVSPIMPQEVTMTAWSLLAIFYASYVLWQTNGLWCIKALGIVVLLWGGIQLANVIMGGRDMLKPFHQFAGQSAVRTDTQSRLVFKKIHNREELQAALANHAQAYAALDFYADWCVACREMEKFTFADSQVQQMLSTALLLQVDVTDNTAEQRDLMKDFQLYGPPAVIFFDKNGKEIDGARVIGYQNPDVFQQRLQQVDNVVSQRMQQQR